MDLNACFLARVRQGKDYANRMYLAASYGLHRRHFLHRRLGCLEVEGIVQLAQLGLRECVRLSETQFLRLT